MPTPQRILAWLTLVVVGVSALPASAEPQIPTVGGAKKFAFHHVIAVEESQQLLGVVTGPDSVLWVVAPSENEARNMRLQDSDEEPVLMTMQASAVRFSSPDPKVTETWKVRERQLKWEKPAPLAGRLELTYAHAKQLRAQRVSVHWNEKKQAWEKTDVAAPAAEPKRIPTPALGAPTQTTVMVGESSVVVTHSYSLEPTKSGMVVKVKIEVPGLVTETVTLPFELDQGIQEAIQKRKDGDKPPLDVVVATAGALDCVPLDERTVLVLSRPTILRAALVETFGRMQTQMIAAAEPRPPYDVFRTFEQAHRAATHLNEVLADRGLTDAETKAVRLSLANAAIYLRSLKLWTSTVQVPLLSGATREVQVFFPAGGSEHRCAPTHAVLIERRVGEKKYLGEMKLDEQKKALELVLQAELVVDPLLHSGVNEILAKTGHKSVGPFTDWTLSPTEPKTTGLRSVTVNDQKQGRLTLTLVLDSEQANLVLWTLATSAGLPLKFTWKSGPAGSESSGEIEIPFSLGRRQNQPLTIGQGKLTNGSPWVVSAEYIQVGDQLLRPKQPGGVLLLPGKSAELKEFLPQAADLAKATIPSTAVAVETANPLDEFVQPAELTDKLLVRNLLPALDPKRELALRFVEVTVIQDREIGGKKQPLKAEPFKLAPEGAAGSDQTLSFLKGSGKVSYRVNAKAYYADGSTDDLKQVASDGSEVILTASLIPKPKSP